MPEENEPIVNPDEMVEQAEAELEGLTPEEPVAEEVEGVADEPQPVAAQPTPEVPDAETQAFFSNLQRLTATQEEEFRTYDPEAEDLVSYTRDASAHAARTAASDAFKAQQAFSMMIERVPEAFRDEIRAMVVSDDAAMSNPRSVAQAIAASVGLKILAGPGKKATVSAKAPQATRQVGTAAQAPQGANDPEYVAFRKAFGYTEKEYPYSRWKAEGVR